MFTITNNTIARYRAITITPVSTKNNGNGSLTNYNVEKQRETQGYNACWTDAPENNSKVGDLFAFVTGAGSAKSTPCNIEVRQIVSIPGPQSDVTRKDWKKGTNSYNDTEGQRNLLVLGPVLGNIEWEVFCEFVKWTPYTKKVNPNNPADPYRTPIQRTQSIRVKI